jgi:hypothetical protein
MRRRGGYMKWIGVAFLALAVLRFLFGSGVLNR